EGRGVGRSAAQPPRIVVAPGRPSRLASRLAGWRAGAAIVCTITALAMLGGPQLHAPEKWPSKRVTLVVPVGAGTITDATARLLAEYLKNHFGQPFLVENRPGAGAT